MLENLPPLEIVLKRVACKQDYSTLPPSTCTILSASLILLLSQTKNFYPKGTHPVLIAPHNGGHACDVMGY